MKETLVPIAKMRDSNIELFRIVLMLMIIAHHYVVNSGITDLFDYNNITGNMVFFQFFGWGGKTGINCFLLITGFFMCKQEFTWRKLLKLVLEIKFYQFAIWAIFLFTGYQRFSFYDLYLNTFSISLGLGRNFVSGYVVLFLLVPFLNTLIKSLNKKELLWLVVLLVIICSVIPTLVLASFYEYTVWYVAMYLIGSYLRIYPPQFIFRTRTLTWFWLSMLVLTMIFASIIFMDYAKRLGVESSNWDYFVSDSNKVLALIGSVTFFLLFKRINIGHVKLINNVAKTVFGVFMIHTQSDTMRQWLWKDVFDCAGQYGSSTAWINALIAINLVFVACAIIDYMRINLLEKPLFSIIDKKYLKK